MKYLISITFILLFAICVSAQVDEVCISQDAANTCRDLALEKPALENKIAVLEQALKDERADKEKIKAKLIEVQTELARMSGQLTATEAENVRMQKIIEALIPMLRKKKVGLINIF